MDFLLTVTLAIVRSYSPSREFALDESECALHEAFGDRLKTFPCRAMTLCHCVLSFHFAPASVFPGLLGGDGKLDDGCVPFAGSLVSPFLPTSTNDGELIDHDEFLSALFLLGHEKREWRLLRSRGSAFCRWDPKNLESSVLKRAGRAITVQILWGDPTKAETDDGALAQGFRPKQCRQARGGAKEGGRIEKRWSWNQALTPKLAERRAPRISKEAQQRRDEGRRTAGGLSGANAFPGCRSSKLNFGSWDNVGNRRRD